MPEFAVSTTAPCALRPAPFSLVEQPPGGLDTSIGVSGSGARVATVIASRKFLATLPRSNVARPSRDSPPGPETKCQKAAAAFDPHASLRSVRMTVLYPRRKKVYDRRRAVVPTNKPGNRCGDAAASQAGLARGPGAWSSWSLDAGARWTGDRAPRARPRRLAAAGGLISPHSPPCPAVPRRKSARHVARVAQHPARA